jgi:CspA family cold shock protein
MSGSCRHAELVLLGHEATIARDSVGELSGHEDIRRAGARGCLRDGEAHMGRIMLRNDAQSVVAQNRVVCRTRRGTAQERTGTMPTGTVKFFNSEKGFGFISRADAEDIFVHFSNIDGEGRRDLEVGQSVEFEIGPGRKGDEARNVRVV